jgi:hypothetical protein
MSVKSGETRPSNHLYRKPVPDGPHLAERLAKRMRECPGLEVVLVVPKKHGSLLESQIMREGRVRFIRTLETAGLADRFALLYPNVSEAGREVDVMVHSRTPRASLRLVRDQTKGNLRSESVDV